MSSLILVVDDEPKIVRLVSGYFEKNGFRVISARDGLTALALARQEKPDLIVLDLLLPGMDGREVCRTLRAESSVPIIMLTALSDETDQIVGLEIGADDYIIKPFSPRTLVARARAILRRVQDNVRNLEIIRAGELEINPEDYAVAWKGVPFHLTPSEFDLLLMLVRRPGQTLTREQLLDNLYGGAASSVDRSIDSHIKNLRRKLNLASDENLIETIYGVGYRFIAGREK